MCASVVYQVRIMTSVKVNEAAGKIRSLLAAFCADCIFCCLRTRVSSTKMKRIIKREDKSQEHIEK